ncbi:hypothetical protein SAY86_004845 [Trapa natans]|uniref:Uncharacterized protein n=1 Tax=Trapa natans TaxID=22666 RepID=A0AAN7N7D4_TRANT|nr:hypothetical protein SAY86_004845 [Trapa natans]
MWAFTAQGPGEEAIAMMTSMHDHAVSLRGEEVLVARTCPVDPIVPHNKHVDIICSPTQVTADS